MALISRKKKNTEVADVAKSTPSLRVTTAHTIIHPRVTEKASDMAINKNVYVFEIQKSATKADVRRAVIELYKVSPVKIAVVTIPGKKVFVRGKKGVRSSGKKAYVYVKKGDKIEII